MTQHSEISVQYRSVKHPRIEFGLGGLKVILPQRYTGSIDELLLRHESWIKKRRAILESLQSGQLPLIHRQEDDFLDLVNEQLMDSVRLVQKQPTKLRLRMMKSRWGSCKRTGEITLSKKLLQVPGDLIGYVVHHEVCHLVHMNHGAGFWQLVAVKYPEHKALRKKLMYYGLLLN